jgi:hypothetical protein
MVGLPCPLAARQHLIVAGNTSEPCDWCGRPGKVRQHDFWNEDGVLAFRNPSLCDVCFLAWDAPGEAIDAYEEAGGHDYHETLEPFEAELARKWQEKVAQGRRLPPGPETSPLTAVHMVCSPDGEKGLPQMGPKSQRLVMRPEIDAESPLWNEQGHMVWLDLPLGSELRRRLGDWADLACESDDDDVMAEGRALYAELTRQLGDRYEVVWHAD